MELTMQERAARLRDNPHNIGAGRMDNFNITAARFEQEGRNARLGAANPYNAGTMAANRFEAGQHWRQGERLFANGYPEPKAIGPMGAAMREGYQANRAYYLDAIERGARP